MVAAAIPIVDEVSIVVTQQRGVYPPNTRMLVPVGMAHDMIQAGYAAIHPDSKKDWEYWGALYAKADAKESMEGSARGALNAKAAAESKKIVEHPDTIARLKTGHGSPPRAKRK